MDFIIVLFFMGVLACLLFTKKGRRVFLEEKGDSPLFSQAAARHLACWLDKAPPIDSPPQAAQVACLGSPNVKHSIG
jgi:hypothetical protein